MPQPECLMVAEAFLQPDEQLLLPASCDRVCRQALVDIAYIHEIQSVPCNRASDHAGLVRLACWAHLREAALAGRRWRWMWTNGMLHTDRASYLERGAKINRKHPGHISSRSSLAGCWHPNGGLQQINLIVPSA